MKLAFSTLGCPDWTFSEMMSTAKDLGFEAIEIRGIEKEVFAPFAKPFKDIHIEKTKQSLIEKGLKISNLSSGVCVGDVNHIESALGEAVVYINLAARLGVKYVRVMISNKPYAENSCIESAVVTYKKICDYAQAKGVIPLIETNAELADSKVMKQFMEDVNRENSGVLWDVHHPYRYFNETPQETYANIGKYVKYVHVKDSVMENGEVKYKLMGKGDVPVSEAIKVLKDNGYDSYITLEWVKRWCPELEEAGIVFSHFVSYFNTICDK